MTYEEAKRLRDYFENMVKAAQNEMKVFPRLSNGLTPDSVKFSQEYRKAKANLDDKFARLRAFNATFTRDFKNEIRNERRSRTVANH